MSILGFLPVLTFIIGVAVGRKRCPKLVTPIPNNEKLQAEKYKSDVAKYRKEQNTTNSLIF